MQDRRVPQDAHIYSEILPCVEREVLHAQATAPTSGGTLIFAMAHPGDGLGSQTTVLGA